MNKSISMYSALLILLFAPLFLHAQESHVAILVNTTSSRMNYGHLNSSLADYKKDVNGLRIGLSLQTGITRNFSLVTEAYFLRKGGILISGNPLNGVESSLKLNTLEMPVLARLHAGRFYFNAGPYINYVMSGKKSTENAPTTDILFESGSDAFRKWEAGILGGVGYQFPVKKRRMALEVRYSHGLTSIHSTENLYNRTLSISVSLIKPLKRRGQ
ncbi:MAG: PorT family protein [Cyclobacteriaceae bacterium]|nr:PorT family protein [Cyclobacteriaceae bacterium]